MEDLNPPLHLRFPDPNPDNTYTVTTDFAAELLRFVQHYRAQLERCRLP